MNPELPAPSFTPESPQPAPREAEAVPVNPEVGVEQGYEKEQTLQRTDTAPLAPPPQVAVPLPPMPVPVPVQATPTDDTTNPTIASDDDLIEKEWVDKAKKIIAETRDDPYRREQEVSKLQADYLRKRYGKELGVTD